MPAIISDSKQQQALQQVSDGLKAVADINTMLDIAAKDNAFTVSAKSRKKPAIVVDEQAATRIQSAMKNFREKWSRKSAIPLKGSVLHCPRRMRLFSTGA